MDSEIKRFSKIVELPNVKTQLKDHFETALKKNDGSDQEEEESSSSSQSSFSLNSSSLNMMQSRAADRQEMEIVNNLKKLNGGFNGSFKGSIRNDKIRHSILDIPKLSASNQKKVSKSMASKSESHVHSGSNCNLNMSESSECSVSDMQPSEP